MAGSFDNRASGSDFGKAAVITQPESSTVKNNGYFKFPGDPHDVDARVKILPRWVCILEDGGMEVTKKSKTLAIALFHKSLDREPKLIVLTLRTWMIHRFQQHIFASSSERKNSSKCQIMKPCNGIHAVHGANGKTDYLQADRFIQNWAPYVFAQ